MVCGIYPSVWWILSSSDRENRPTRYALDYIQMLVCRIDLVSSWLNFLILGFSDCNNCVESRQEDSSLMFSPSAWLPPSLECIASFGCTVFNWVPSLKISKTILLLNGEKMCMACQLVVNLAEVSPVLILEEHLSFLIGKANYKAVNIFESCHILFPFIKKKIPEYLHCSQQ